MDINKHILQGGVVSKPQVNRFPDGALARFRVATTRRVFRNGEWVERKSYHNVVVKGHDVDKVEHMEVGDCIYVSGYAEDYEFTDTKTNAKGWKRQLVAEEVGMPYRLHAKREESNPDAGYKPAVPEASQPPATPPSPPAPTPAPAPASSPAAPQNRSQQTRDDRRDRSEGADQSRAPYSTSQPGVRQAPQQRTPPSSNGGGYQRQPEVPVRDQRAGAPSDDLPADDDPFGWVDDQIENSRGYVP